MGTGPFSPPFCFLPFFVSFVCFVVIYPSSSDGSQPTRSAEARSFSSARF